MVLLGRGQEVQRAPGDGDAPVADAHEAAEIDHGGAGLALVVDEDVDDAADLLVARVRGRSVPRMPVASPGR